MPIGQTLGCDCCPRICTDFTALSRMAFTETLSGSLPGSAPSGSCCSSLNAAVSFAYWTRMSAATWNGLASSFHPCSVAAAKAGTFVCEFRTTDVLSCLAAGVSFKSRYFYTSAAGDLRVYGGYFGFGGVGGDAVYYYDKILTAGTCAPFSTSGSWTNCSGTPNTTECTVLTGWTLEGVAL